MLEVVTLGRGILVDLLLLLLGAITALYFYITRHWAKFSSQVGCNMCGRHPIVFPGRPVRQTQLPLWLRQHLAGIHAEDCLHEAHGLLQGDTGGEGAAQGEVADGNRCNVQSSQILRAVHVRPTNTDGGG